MAFAIMLSTFGTVNALTLAGARACYAISKDKLFFPAAGKLNRACVPGWALGIQGFWSVLLVLPRTFNATSGEYGNLYSNLLEYVISAALVFYILTILGVFRLRHTRPLAERPYKTWGYPWFPALYITGASIILLVLFIYRPETTWPGIAIVVLGIPVYYAMRLSSRAAR
jgi:APA family basic amino acid/polyamine antiporter